MTTAMVSKGEYVIPAKPRWYAINNKAETKTASIDIFDEIGVWGISAKDFVAELRDLDAEKIQLNVNSPGGDVFDGIAILNALRTHPAKITATVQGLAASAASFILMGADEVVMAPNTELMIHDPHGLVMGGAEDMQAMAANLTRVSENIASIYAEKAGGDVKAWRKAMAAETWYSADEAVTAGLADRVDGQPDATAQARVPIWNKAAFDLSKVARYSGRAAAPAPYLPSNHMPPAEQLAEHPSPTEGVADMPSDTLVTGLRSRLGIPADADLDEDGILAALDEVLAEQSATPPPVVQNAVPAGTVLIDEAEYADLRAAAAMGREARERQIADERQSVVNRAVSEGRIPPARRDHWVAQLAADPGASDVLNSLAKGTIPLNELGYTGGVDEASDDDTLYNSLFSKEAANHG